MKRSWSRSGPAACLCALLLAQAALAAAADDAGAERDRAAVRAHLERIFQAFVDQDVDTLRATHAADWVGFKLSGREIVRGRDGYLKGAVASFANPMRTYRIEDSEVQLLGDVAVIYYVATFTSDVKAAGGPVTFHMRCADVLRRTGLGWIQVGSNLNLQPRPGSTAKPTCGQECFEIDLGSGAVP